MSSDGVKPLIEIGAAKEPYLDLMVRGNMLPHRDWLKLNNERHGLRRAFAAFFADWDVLLCPVAASAAWPHDHKGERWTRKITVNDTQVRIDRSAILGRLFEPRLFAFDCGSCRSHQVGTSSRLSGDCRKRS